MAERDGLRMSWWDRLLLSVAPAYGLRRVQARATIELFQRHFESASSGYRTSGWSRNSTDANAAAAGPALSLLRAQARDLVRNNPWARRGLRRIKTDTVGWGVRPKATGRGAARVAELWKRWAESTECDAAGRQTFYGLQALVMRTVVESGECLVRRRRRLLSDGLAIPLQLQVLEPDHLDTGKDGLVGSGGGKIIQGVEFDAIGRRVAYWLFEEHPGSRFATAESKRVPADGVLHVFDQERPGQVRGPSWFASVDVRLHEFDEFEDATLVKQKIAACMTAFVKDINADPSPLAKGGTDAKSGQPTDQMGPGLIMTLPPGRDVTIAQPPAATDHQSFSATTLRGVAAGLGTTYEDLTGDYSQVNYSSARMARIAHTGDVHDWRWNMLIPQFCAPTWKWMLDTLALAGEDVEIAPAKWTPAPLPMLDPDKEGAATTKAVRAGQMTPDEMVREQGFDPDEHWGEYAASFKRLDELGIVIDADPRKITSAGQAQATAPAAAKKPVADADEGSTDDGSGTGDDPADA